MIVVTPPGIGRPYLPMQALVVLINSIREQVLRLPNSLHRLEQRVVPRRQTGQHEATCFLSQVSAKHMTRQTRGISHGGRRRDLVQFCFGLGGQRQAQIIRDAVVEILKRVHGQVRLFDVVKIAGSICVSLLQPATAGSIGDFDREFQLRAA